MGLAGQPSEGRGVDDPVAVALERAGFSERLVEKVCLGNMLRVFGEVLP